MSNENFGLKLPPPPSTNGLFATVGRRRIKSRRYRAWLNEAGWEIQRQRLGTIGGPWEADIALPAGLRGDCDNYAKPILDMLVKHRVVDDDRYCQRLTIAKTATVGSVIITLMAARDSARIPTARGGTAHYEGNRRADQSALSIAWGSKKTPYNI